MPRAKTPDPTDKHVGSRVRMRRLVLGMSQGKLADGLGLTFQQVQKYEKGVNRIGASRLQQIADILEVPVAFFFEAQAAPGAPDPSKDFMTDRHGIALMCVWAKVPDATRAALVTVAEAAVSGPGRTATKRAA